MLVFTDENFEKEIGSSQKPVLVDFWAAHCPACTFLSPVLEKIAKDYQDRVVFAKADIETAPRVSQHYGIDLIPTVILFNAGKVVSGFIGAKPEEEIKVWLDKELKG